MRGVELISRLSQVDSNGAFSGYQLHEGSPHLAGLGPQNDLCIFLRTDETEDSAVPQRFAHFSVAHKVRCGISVPGGEFFEGEYSVLRTNLDGVDDRAALVSVAIALWTDVGITSPRSVNKAVRTLARIFRRESQFEGHSAELGLWAELYFILTVSVPDNGLAAWQIQDTSAFDFDFAGAVLDVKASMGTRFEVRCGQRQLVASPADIRSRVLALLQVIEGESGDTLIDLAEGIIRLSAYPELTRLRVYEAIFSRMGPELSESRFRRFQPRVEPEPWLFFDLKAGLISSHCIPSAIVDSTFLINLGELSTIARPALEGLGIDC